LAQDNIGARMMGKFFGWYAPRFSAYSFPLARKNEYEADAMAATLTSPQAIGDALINVHVVAPYLEENYWQSYFKRADKEEVPEVLPWEGLHGFLQTNSDPKLQERLDQALLLNTDLSDTHPSLKDRLKALAVPEELPAAAQVNAAKAWLMDQYEAVIGEFDGDWFQTNSEFGERTTAIELVSLFRERNPENESAAYLLGCYFMADEDEKCLPLFEAALSSPELAYNACANAFDFLTNAGKPEEAEVWRVKAEKSNDLLEEAQSERDRLNPGDTLAKVDLDDDYVKTVIAKLKQSNKIKKAWIAKKVVKHYPEQPAIAIAVIGKGFALSEDSLQQALAEEMSEFSLWIIPKSGDYKPLAKEIIAAGEQII